jgi:hypothetical protein
MTPFQAFLIVLFFVSVAGILYVDIQVSTTRILVVKREPSGKPVRYVLAGGGLGFLCGICFSGLLLIDFCRRGGVLDFKVLLLLLILCVFSGLSGAGKVMITALRARNYRRRFDRVEESRKSEKMND